MRDANGQSTGPTFGSVIPFVTDELVAIADLSDPTAAHQELLAGIGILHLQAQLPVRAIPVVLLRGLAEIDVPVDISPPTPILEQLLLVQAVLRTEQAPEELVVLLERLQRRMPFRHVARYDDLQVLVLGQQQLLETALVV